MWPAKCVCVTLWEREREREREAGELILQQWDFYSISVIAVSPPLCCLLCHRKWCFPFGTVGKWCINCTFLWDGLERRVYETAVSSFLQSSLSVYLSLPLLFCSSLQSYPLSSCIYMCASVCLWGWDGLVNSYSSIWLHNSNSHPTLSLSHTHTHTHTHTPSKHSIVVCLRCVYATSEWPGDWYHSSRLGVLWFFSQCLSFAVVVVLSCWWYAAVCVSCLTLHKCAFLCVSSVAEPMQTNGALLPNSLALLCLI